MNKEKFNHKILAFAASLSDAYKDDDERVGASAGKLELNEDELTDDFTAMIYAAWVLYKRITGDEIDILEFTYVANRLVVQKLREEAECVDK